MTRKLVCFFIAVLLTTNAVQNALAQRSWDGGNGTFVWSDLGNWNPDGTPASEPITIGDLAAAANDTTLLDLAFTIDSLTISAGADVDTTVNEVTVNGLTTVGGIGSSIIVRPHTTSGQESLDTQGLTVNADGILSLRGESGSTDGGIVELESGLFQINLGGDAGGHGTIELINSTTVGQAMENSGRLFVSSRPGTIFGVLPGTLTITNGAFGTGTLDLDGDGDAGAVDVDDGSLINFTSLTLNIDVPLADGFSGTMDIGNGDTVNITNAWTADLDGIINLNGTGTHTLTGGALTVNGAVTQVNLNAGTTVFDNNLTVTDGDFVLATDAAVQFDGTTTFDDATDFTNGNNTTITVNSVVNIGVTAVVGEDFNWDGGGFAANQTIVNAAGDLNINVENVEGGVDDTYNGTITMNSGNIDVQVSDAVWVMDSVLNINNSATNTPVLSGDTIEIGNDLTALSADVNVGGTGVSQISAPITFQSDADVNVAAGAILQTGTVTFQSVNAAVNAEFTGTGTWRLTGTNTVSELTTINMTGGTVDLDNSEAVGLFANDTNVNAPLTINAATMANYGSTRVFLGTPSFSDLNVDNLGLETGTLTVNLDDPLAEWTVLSVGIVNLTNDNSAAALLAGSDVNMNGTLNVTGDVLTTARMDIGSTGTVNILTAAEPFRLSGGTTLDPNTINGGTVNGPGLLGADTGSALVGSGTINATVDFDGSSNLQADNATLNVNTIVDVGTLGTADADGVLNVIPAWNTNVTQTVVLNGGTLQGGAITNDGAAGINGRGLITANITNNTRVDAEGGGTLTLQGQTPANLDGAGAGSLNAISGNLTVVYGANTAVNFAGTVRVDAGQEFFGDLTLWNFLAGSTLDLNGGRFRSNLSTVINGTVDVAAGSDSVIENPNLARFASTSNTLLNGNLRLVGAPEIQAGATFTGGGLLINTAGSTLTLVDGADVDVSLQNNGTLVLGASPGQTQGLDFQQTATGAWNVELGGTGINDYDRMTLSSVAALGGTLNLSLIGGYVPTLADPALTILTASSVGGTFASVTQPAGMPAGLNFDVVYNAGNVQLVVAPALSGDYNNNGTVDAADYALWRDGGPLQNDPTPGVQPADYDFWRAHFGQTVGSGSGAGVNAAVPEPTTFIVLLGAVVLPAVVRLRRSFDRR